MPVVSMPKLSDTMTEGVLVKWIKNEGDAVAVSDVIAEVETDKATMEMEAFDDGTLKIYASEGAKVPVGGAIAFIAAEGEEAPASPPNNGDSPAPAAEAAPPAASAPAAPASPPATAGFTVAPESAPTTGSGPLKTSPVAAKIAAERGVDLAAIRGTGPGGRIIKRDVLAHAEGGGAAAAPPVATLIPAAPVSPAPAPVAPASPPFLPAPGSGDERIALTGMRSTIAQRLLQSKTQIPHAYLHLEVDAGPLMELRKQVNAAAATIEGANKYTINDFILKAAVGAARKVPEVNASFAGDAIVRYASINLSLAVAVDEGLVTPVIRDAQDRSLLEISVAVKDLASRARNKRLSPDEFQGGTLTVSNLGAYGVHTFDAIINPPQAAILSVGTIVAKPVVNEAGEIVPGHRMDVGLSFDHRVIDGAIGATFLSEFRKLIESPALMLV